MDFFKQFTPKLLPTVVALLLFFVVSALYFAPQFQGEVLPQHDIIQYQGMTKDINYMRQTTGEDPQWTGGMFGGMPAYLINVAYPSQIIKHSIGRIAGLLDTPAGFTFFAMTAMWLMLLLFGVNPWVGIVAALAYGLSTYFLLIIGAGHNTKMWALVYAPLMMGGAWTTLRGRMWAGAALTAVAASLEIGANHPQITYYFLMAMAAMWISEGVRSYRKKLLKPFARRTVVLAAAGILAVGSNFSSLWYTAQHTKDTMRGGSELTVGAESKTPSSGLDLDYATAWSYGRGETLNLLIPDFMGRESGQTFSVDGPVAKTLNGYGLQGAAQQLPTYWGDQPYTGGPTYLGAVALFLAAIGLIITRGNRWWIVAISLLMILLAWGNNFMGFTELAFKILPGYNKFRTVSMTLVVVQWAVPMLGALALMKLWRGEQTRQQILRAVAWAAGVTGGLCLLLAITGSLFFDFGQQKDAMMLGEQFNNILQANNMQAEIAKGLDIQMAQESAQAMAEERIEMMQGDAWRSLLFILLAAGTVVLFAFSRINRYILIGVMALLVVADLVPVDRRFLSSEDFTTPRHSQITATQADKIIMEDKELGYRVFNTTVSPFNDATTSYFHRSVGGYHGAKLSRYQDLIDRYLSQGDQKVLDMLNTRYIITQGQNGQPQPIRRTTEYGPAWLVDSVVYAQSPQQEIDLLGQIDTRTTAVVKQGTKIDGLGQGQISLVEYRPNYLKYNYTASAPATAIFSEIYYDKGWQAFIDGQPAQYFRADYVLRALALPQGEHTVEWRFRAPAWGTVEGVTLASSIIILLGAIGALLAPLFCKREEE